MTPLSRDGATPLIAPSAIHTEPTAPGGQTRPTQCGAGEKNMWRSMVCGALWWSPDQTRPLRGQIAKFIFLWHWGTAVSLASGSRLVIPALDRTRPRSPQPHCTHTHFTKNGQRASPCEYLVIIGSPLWVLTTVHHLAYSCWFSSALMSTDRGRRVGAALAGPDAPELP